MSDSGKRNERCGTCRFWVSGSSECRRRAPQIVAQPTRSGESLGAAGAWPITGADAWCGEWVTVADAEPAPVSTAQGSDDSVATCLFLARVAPGLNARNPTALLESLLDQLPSDVRQVLVRTHGLDGRPPAGLKDVARECKMSQGHVRSLIATGEELLTDVVRLLTRQRERL